MALNSKVFDQLKTVISDGHWALWRHGYLIHLGAENSPKMSSNMVRSWKK